MRPFYIFSGSLISKENDSILIKKEDGEINLPIEAIDSLFIFGNTTITSPILNILAKKGHSNYYIFLQRELYNLYNARKFS